jgi:hypothetical protein
MTQTGILVSWLAAPSVRGPKALALGIAMVAIPTCIRAAVDGIVTGCEFTVFLPFVFVSAFFMEWRYAAAVALACVGLADYLFMAPPRTFIQGPCNTYVVAIYLAASALIIGAFAVIRTMVAESFSPGDLQGQAGPVVFSLEEDQAWAGWHGRRSTVRLGQKDDVAEMMEDFLAQLELAERLKKPSA